MSEGPLCKVSGAILQRGASVALGKLVRQLFTNRYSHTSAVLHLGSPSTGLFILVQVKQYLREVWAVVENVWLLSTFIFGRSGVFHLNLGSELETQDLFLASTWG